MDKTKSLFTLFDEKNADNYSIVLLVLDLVFVIIYFINAMTSLLNSEKKRVTDEKELIY